MYYAIHAVIACNFVFYLVKFIDVFALCIPREKLWKPVRQTCFLSCLPAFEIYTSKEI